MHILLLLTLWGGRSLNHYLGFSPQEFMHIKNYQSTKFDSSNVRFVGNWPFGICWELTYGKINSVPYVFQASGGAVVILDVSDSLHPVEVSDKIYTRGVVYKLFFDSINNLLYAAVGYQGIEIWNVSNPTNPSRISLYNVSEYASGVYVSGTYAYVAEGDSGLEILDISNPVNPTHISTYNTSGQVWNVITKDTLAFISDGSRGMKILNVSVPSSPVLVGSTTVAPVFYTFIKDTFAYMLSDTSLEIINVADPTLPSKVGSYDSLFYPYRVVVIDTFAYITELFNGLFDVLSVSDPMHPYRISSSSSFGYPGGLIVSGKLSYISDLIWGLRISDISNPSTVSEVSNYKVSSFPPSDIFVVDTFAYLAAGEEGLKIINISNPLTSYQTGGYDTPGTSEGLTIIDSFAYIADGDSGLRIINIKDPTNPTETGYYDTPGYAKGIYILDTLAYVPDGDSGIRIINVSDPVSPFEVGHYDTSGFANCIWVIDTIAYAGFSDTFRILNVKDPSNPVLLGNTAIEVIDLQVKDTLAYICSHSAISIFNVSDPTNPVKLGEYAPSGYLFYGLYIEGNYLYVANSYDGLKIIDVSDPTNSVEVGYYPPPDRAEAVYNAGPYVYIADWSAGLQIYKNLLYGINEEQPPKITQNIFKISPNIARSKFTITFSTPENRYVNISLYDISGRKVKNLYSGNIRGKHRFFFGINIPSGIYFIRGEGENGEMLGIRKIIKIK